MKAGVNGSQKTSLHGKAIIAKTVSHPDQSITRSNKTLSITFDGQTPISFTLEKGPPTAICLISPSWVWMSR